MSRAFEVETRKHKLRIPFKICFNDKNDKVTINQP